MTVWLKDQAGIGTARLACYARKRIAGSICIHAISRYCHEVWCARLIVLPVCRHANRVMRQAPGAHLARTTTSDKNDYETCARYLARPLGRGRIFSRPTGDALHATPRLHRTRSTGTHRHAGTGEAPPARPPGRARRQAGPPAQKVKISPVANPIKAICDKLGSASQFPVSTGLRRARTPVGAPCA